MSSVLVSSNTVHLSLSSTQDCPRRACLDEQLLGGGGAEARYRTHGSSVLHSLPRATEQDETSLKSTKKERKGQSGLRNDHHR